MMDVGVGQRKPRRERVPSRGRVYNSQRMDPMASLTPALPMWPPGNMTCVCLSFLLAKCIY